MDLKELLGEELYNQVIEKAGDNKLAIVSDGNWFPKEKFNSVNEDNKELRSQLKERDTQLEELSKKAKGNEELTAQIDELKQQNETTKTEYEEKLQKQAFNHALDRAIAEVNPKTENSAKAIKVLLDTEAIKLDGDKLLNLDDQLDALKESDSYLFESEESEDNKPNFTTGQHHKGGNTVKNIAEMSYQELADLKANNPAKFAELTK